MSQRITEHTVGQLAQLSGVSVRTLHHYDAIGLLTPAYVGINGYRLYGRAEELRLQEILLYREVGMPLDQIGALLDSPVPALDRLIEHRAAVASALDRQHRVLETLDATIAHMKGATDMTTKDLYKPFSDKQQADYEAWLIKTYGADMANSIKASKQAVTDLPEGMAGAMQELKNIEADLVQRFEDDRAFDAPELHMICEEHRALMARLWGKDCPAEGYRGLGQMYLAHPDFVARYEALSPRFSDWLPKAMSAHADRLLTTG